MSNYSDNDLLELGAILYNIGKVLEKSQIEVKDLEEMLSIWALEHLGSKKFPIEEFQRFDYFHQVQRDLFVAVTNLSSAIRNSSAAQFFISEGDLLCDIWLEDIKKNICNPTECSDNEGVLKELKDKPKSYCLFFVDL